MKVERNAENLVQYSLNLPVYLDSSPFIIFDKKVHNFETTINLKLRSLYMLKGSPWNSNLRHESSRSELN